MKNQPILALLLMTLIFSALSCSSPERYGGLALYTVRDDMKSSPKEVLQKVADLGYAYIEAAGYEDGKFYGMEPEAFKSYLNEVGLTPLSSHNSGI
ncbi:MAG: sugar phosphate isomerase/epimerase, partial [Phaeodactylibacter sp.]|nr:sugar phosphate isomerase/epimerase [Phaeodactylibacter sp.]